MCSTASSILHLTTQKPYGVIQNFIVSAEELQNVGAAVDFLEVDMK